MILRLTPKIILENTYFNIYDVFCLFGAFLAFLLVIFNKKFKTKSNIALAIALFSVSLLVLYNIFTALALVLNHISPSSDFVIPEALIFYLPTFYTFFIPFGFYYSIKYLLDPDYKFQQRDYWAFIPVFFVGIIDLIFLFLYLFSYDVIKDHSYLRRWYGDIFLNTIVPLYIIISSTLSWKQINQYQKQLLNNYAHIEGRDLQWLRATLKFSFTIIIIFIAFRVAFIFFPVYHKVFFYIIWLLITAFMCFIAFQVIINQNFYLIPHFKEKKEKLEPVKVLSEKTDEHHQYLLALMQKEKLYHDNDLNMDTLAEKIQLSKGYISRIINQKEGKNFYDFVNTFRIEEVKKNLNNPDFAHYSILGIGLAAGFKSKSTFNTVFKKMTGMTPSAYKKTLK